MKRISLLEGIVLAIVLIGGFGVAFAQKPSISITTMYARTGETDQITREQVKEWGRLRGVNVRLEFVSEDDCAAKVATAVETGVGTDIMIAPPFLASLYGDSLVPVDDLASELGDKLGGWYPIAELISAHWRAIPFLCFNHVINIRTDLVSAAGESLPSSDWTWEDLLTLAKKIKIAAGVPCGFALGHAHGDGNNFAYGALWSYGGHVVEKDGKTIALDSPETREALSFVKRLYSETMLPGVIGWDDSTNNRAFLAGAISMTNNTGSIYWAAKESGSFIAENMTHQLYPKGPAGRIRYSEMWMYGIMKYAKHPELCKDLLAYLMDKEQYTPWMVSCGGWTSPTIREYGRHPMWEKPILAPFAQDTQYQVNLGYPGPYTREAAEVNAWFVLLDMFARACTGIDIEDSIKWAVQEIKVIYGK